MGQPAESPAVESTWLAVYKYFMEAVDGIDNGEHGSPLCINCWQMGYDSAPPT